MAIPQSLSPEVLLHISQQLNLPLRGLVAVIELLDEGGTVPFIARYRKEPTGNLDEVQIRQIEEQLAYFRELPARKACGSRACRCGSATRARARRRRAWCASTA